MATPIGSSNSGIGPADFSQPSEQGTGGLGQNQGRETEIVQESTSFTTRSGERVDVGGFGFTPPDRSTPRPSQDDSAISALGRQNGLTNTGNPIKTEPTNPPIPPRGNRDWEIIGESGSLGNTPELEISLGINTPFGSGKVSHTASDGNTKASVETPGSLTVESDTEDRSAVNGNFPGGIKAGITSTGDAGVEVTVPVGLYAGVTVGAGVIEDQTAVTAGGRIGPPGLNIDGKVTAIGMFDDGPFDAALNMEPVNKIAPEAVGTETRVGTFALLHGGPEITSTLPERPAAMPAVKPGVPDFSESQLIDFQSIPNTPNLGPKAQ